VITYGGALNLMVVIHPKSGTVHHAANAQAGDTQCGFWLPGRGEQWPASRAHSQRHRLCKRCWIMSWFEEKEQS